MRSYNIHKMEKILFLNNLAIYIIWIIYDFIIMGVIDTMGPFLFISFMK